MEQKQFVKGVIDFQRSAFEKGFDAIVTLQDQAEKMATAFLGQATWIPEEGKGAMAEWSKIYKKGRDDFKKAVSDGYTKAESFLTSSINI
ncbi:MAG: hypothetical protein JW896_18355 [Deltaproteobacteria bacterium]|nr:hypothetical protein [Deltaproteobacteria bacterium]